MRAAILNGTMSAGPEIDPALTIPTTDPALVGTEVFLPSTREPAFSPEKLQKWVETGAKIQKSGKVALGGVDFQEMLKAMTTGMAVAAVIPGVGPLVGLVAGAVYYAIKTFTGGVAKDWVDAAPGVHDWFTRYGPQAFLEYVRAERPELLGATIPEITRALLLWWLEKDGVVITDAPGKSHYNNEPDWVYWNMAGGYAPLVELYAAVGVDYPKTRLEAHPAGEVSADGVSEGLGGVWMLNRKVYTKKDTPQSAPKGSGKGILLTAGAALAVYAIYKHNN